MEQKICRQGLEDIDVRNEEIKSINDNWKKREKEWDEEHNH